MILHHHPVAGESVCIKLLENVADVPEFQDWLTAPRLALGLDVETTGLNTFHPDFTIRTVQFGDAQTAYVIPNRPEFFTTITDALARAPRLVLHNAPFDLLALDRFRFLDLEETWPRVFDTRTMAHLLDPRT